MSAQTWSATIAVLLPLLGAVSQLVREIADRSQIKVNLEIATLLRARHAGAADRLEHQAIAQLEATAPTRERITFALTVLVSLALCMHLWLSGARQLAGLALLAAMAAMRITWAAIGLRHAVLRADREGRVPLKRGSDP